MILRIPRCKVTGYQTKSSKPRSEDSKDARTQPEGWVTPPFGEIRPFLFHKRAHQRDRAGFSTQGLFACPASMKKKVVQRPRIMTAEEMAAIKVCNHFHH